MLLPRLQLNLWYLNIFQQNMMSLEYLSMEDNYSLRNCFLYKAGILKL